MPYGLISPFGNFNGGAWTFNGPVTLPAGTAAAPALNFGSSGLYQAAANTLGVSVNSGALMTLAVAGSNVQFLNKIGTAGTNGYAFYTGNSTLSIVVDSNGVSARVGGFAASPSGAHAASGNILWDGASTHGETATLGTSTATATLSGSTTTVGSNLLPAGCLVLGVTAVLTTAITGSGVTGFTLGDGTTANLFGTATAVAQGTFTDFTKYATAWTPKSYAANGNVVATATGGSFTGGAIRVTTWYMLPTAPTS